MTIPIFISTNKNYIIPAITLIASVMENTSEKCIFYILHSELTKENKIFIQNSLKEYARLSIEFIKISEDIFKNAPPMGHLTKETYYRIMIPELKTEIDKAIYLDSDMIVNCDIKELYNTDIDSFPLAAAQDKVAQYIPYWMLHSYFMGITSLNYFQAGVLVINTKYFRKNNIKQKFFEILEQYKDKIKTADQDILNLIFADNHKKLDYSFNFHVPLENYLILNKDSDLPAFNNPKIYHFASDKKPWNSNCKYEEIWFKYANKLIEEEKLNEFCKQKQPAEGRKEGRKEKIPVTCQ